MQVFEINFSLDATPSEALIENCCAENNLQIALKGTLAKYPGCVHWHLKQGKQRGTLEVTWWPSQRRLWLSIQAGRRADWIEEAAAHLKRAIEEKLNAGIRNPDI